MQGFLLVGAGGALGAMGRYGASVLVMRAGYTGFPYATLIVNILGSLAMGLLVGGLARLTPEWGREAQLFIATGLLGGFTTFSAFSLDAVTLMERGQGMNALAYILASVLASIVALFIGLWFMRLGAA